MNQPAFLDDPSLLEPDKGRSRRPGGVYTCSADPELHRIDRCVLLKCTHGEHFCRPSGSLNYIYIWVEQFAGCMLPCFFVLFYFGRGCVMMCVVFA